MRKPSNPTFITLEGIEGSGKTSQVSVIKDFLARKGLQAVLTREPGGTDISNKIRTLLVESHGEALEPLAELLLYNAARIQHLAQVIRPALAEGKVVICDRYTDATVAYQAYGRKLPLGLVTQINSWATDDLSPELTFLLDCNPRVGLSRAISRLKQEGSKEGRFEAEQFDFHERVRNGYLELADHQKNRFVVINANQEAAEVSTDILKVLESRFA